MFPETSREILEGTRMRFPISSGEADRSSVGRPLPHLKPTARRRQS
jgi:hypothetical protein